MTTFTKNKQTGEFDIIGLDISLAEGQPTVVTKKDGSTTTVIVGKRSKPFTAKFSPLQGRTVVLAKVQGFAGGNGSGRRGGYTPAIRDSRGYVSERGHYDGYCGYDCPVTHRKCCPENGPCHDCM